MLTDPASFEGEVVKHCPKCGVPFTLSALVRDPQVHPIGMQFDSDDLKHCSFYFNHELPLCGSTFAVPLAIFTPLLRESLPPQRLAGSPHCPGHCTRLDELQLCGQPCRNAPYRRFLVETLLRPR